MNPECSTLPDWARYEREADLEWIDENVELFRAVATTAHEEMGRGVIVVDTTAQPIPDAGHPLGYVPQEQIEAYPDKDITRMASEYDPDHELVVVLLKREDHTSTYRISTHPPEPEPAHEIRLQVPDVETRIDWESEGGGVAACE